MVSLARSRIMRAIRSKNTGPEVFVRSLVHRSGFRFRLHYQKLPGKPDLALPKYRAVIFVNGCFWHGHLCHLYNPAKIRPAVWEQKIARNRERDRTTIQHLNTLGWKVLVIWECAVQGKTRLAEAQLMEEISDWIRASSSYREISGGM